MIAKRTFYARQTACALGIIMMTMLPAAAQSLHGSYAAARNPYGIGYVYNGIGIGRAAFPIPGAIPEGTAYDPYRMPYSYDWPYGYGDTSR